MALFAPCPDACIFRAKLDFVEPGRFWPALGRWIETDYRAVTLCAVKQSGTECSNLSACWRSQSPA